MNYEFAQLLGGSRWLMEPKAFRAMVKRAETATPEAIQAAVVAYAERSHGPTMVGDVAVIDACGPITYKRSLFSMYFGGTTIEDMQSQFRMAMADPAIRTVVFRWDSPGGSADMCSEFADEVFAARGQKPIVSFADTMICSAAMWLAAQSDTIYVSASSVVGSIGVFLEHFDISGMLEKDGVKVTLITHGDHKCDGNEFQKLSDDVRADLQAMVDEVGAEFDGAMARGRGVTRKIVADTFGQGKTFRGKQAIAVGLADKVGTFSQVIGKLTKGRVVGSMARASVASGVVITPETVEQMPATMTAVASLTAKKKAETVEPVDGECPEGYELGDDGLCHLEPVADAKADAAAVEVQASGDDSGERQADADLCATTLALTDVMDLNTQKLGAVVYGTDELIEDYGFTR